MNDKERKKRGREAEDFICSYLMSKGCRVIEQNYSAGHFGELDIIAEYESRILFIEVRARQSASKYGGPLESISRSKLKKIRNSINFYLQNNRIMNRSITVLAAGVYMDQKGNIEHFDIVTVESL